MSAEEVFAMWYNEMKNYDLDKPAFPPALVTLHISSGGALLILEQLKSEQVASVML